MRRVLLVLLIAIAPFFTTAALAQHDTTGATAAHGSETEAHKVVHPEETPHSGGEGHTEKTYFGIPGWILKLVNMVLFFGLLGYFVAGPVKRAFADRTAAIRQASEEARERRTRADRMASEIQERLAAIEAEVVAIRERAESEGERQKRELIAAAEAEAEKILQTARNEVDTRLKHARNELTQYAGQLASERAEAILRQTIDENDQRKLFKESLEQVEGARS